MQRIHMKIFLEPWSKELGSTMGEMLRKSMEKSKTLAPLEALEIFQCDWSSQQDEVSWFG